MDERAWSVSAGGLPLHQGSGSCSQAGIGMPGCVLSSLLQSHQEEQSGEGTTVDFIAVRSLRELTSEV